MLITAVLEMASIGMVLPVVHIWFAGDTGTGPLATITRFLPDALTKNSGVWLIVLFAALFVVKNVMVFGLTHLVNLLVYLAAADFIFRLHGVYTRRSLLFHTRNNSAALLRNLFAGAGQSFECIRIFLLMVLDFLLMAVVIALLLAVEPVVTLQLAALMLVAGLVFYRLAAPAFRRWGEKTMELEGHLIKWINQSFDGIRDVKILNAHDHVNRHVGDVARERGIFLSWATSSLQIPRLLIETVVIIGFVLLASWLVSARGATAEAVSLLGLFGMAALRIMPSVNRILSNASNLKNRAAYIDAVHHDYTIAEEAGTNEERQIDRAGLEFNHGIVLDGVNFHYDETGTPAVADIDLTIPKGFKVGIVGPSGAGKTTLVDLFLGLLAPRSGRLLVDGKDIHDNLRAWQDLIGYVPQQPFLIDDTLRRNIAFGLDDEDIDEHRLEIVVASADLGGVVGDLEHGLDSVLGEKGARISGGQRQRVAVARALYRNPEVLVFDEPTSALDNQSEAEFVSNIERQSEAGKTILVVAHRLSTVRRCDLIIFLKNGRIAGQGNLNELMQSNDEFRGLVEMGNVVQPVDQDG
ncbi:MAG: ABC transporter ATP-binding protein [Rhodospirillales bacterium]|nr:ABC transporter ATP-binding protein [Rhodospirillales bacterium]